MRIFNLRKHTIGKYTYLSAKIDTLKGDGELWFSIDSQYSDWLSDDTYDAFLVAAVYWAMYINEDIEICGSVSKSLYRNLVRYVMPLIHELNKQFHKINIFVEDFSIPQKSSLGIIGTGYSGGVDSFSTIFDNYFEEEDSEYKINTLFFFNVGQYKGHNHEERLSRAIQFYNNGLLFAKEIDIPYIFLDTNLFDFYLPHWEYDAGPLCRMACILSLQRVIKIYYISGSNHYIQQNSSLDKHLDDVSDEFIYSLLSPRGLEVILDGNQYYRSQKIQRIANSDIVQKHLNVCVNGETDVLREKNCSVCHKCCRTLLILESLNLLDQFNDIFHINKWQKVRKDYLCRIRLDYGRGAYATENLNFAKEHGMKIPGYIQAWLYLFPQRAINRIRDVLHSKKSVKSVK